MDFTPRRSNRSHVPSKRYTNDAFEIAGIDLPVSTSSSSEQDARSDRETTGRRRGRPRKRAADPLDAVFDANEEKHDGGTSETDIEAADRDEAGADADGVVSADSASEGEESGTQAPDEVEDGSESDIVEVAARPKAKKGQRKPRASKSQPFKGGDHSRGIPNPHDLPSKRAVFNEYLIGTDPQDVTDFAKAAEKWGDDPIMPKKKLDRHGSGGFDFPIGFTKEKRQAVSTQGWDWYYDRNGRILMERAQRSTYLSGIEAEKYYPPIQTEHRVLMGPHDHPQMHTLEGKTALSLQTPWLAGSYELPASTRPPLSSHRGWLLNIGCRVQCLEWAPSQQLSIQYLAICPKHPSPRSSVRPSAFRPGPVYPSSIQIWAFQAGDNGSPDLRREPRPAVVVCHEWGGVRHLKWCPAPRMGRDEGARNKTMIGVLAAVFADGCARVLDIQVDSSSSGGKSQVLHFAEAAFTVRPPNTVCSTVSWLSSTEIAVGCANGYVAIWDLEAAICASSVVPAVPASYPSTTGTFDPLPSIGPAPTIYLSFHESYVLNIIAAYPLHPHFIITASADGFVRLTDLRSPHTRFVLSPRVRPATGVLCYYPHVHAALCPEDSEWIRALPFRRFFSSMVVGKTNGTITAIGSSLVHGCVLVGDVSGFVWAVNPMGRFSFGRGKKNWKGAWFRGEWVRDKADVKDRDGKQRSEEEENRFARKGISRISDGYKPSPQQLSRTQTKSKKPKGMESSVVVQTIYEEEQAVTGISWNPNLEYGGWAAAAMGSGLVRVEDISI